MPPCAATPKDDSGRPGRGARPRCDGDCGMTAKSGSSSVPMSFVSSVSDRTRLPNGPVAAITSSYVWLWFRLRRFSMRALPIFPPRKVAVHTENLDCGGESVFYYVLHHRYPDSRALSMRRAISILVFDCEKFEYVLSTTAA